MTPQKIAGIVLVILVIAAGGYFAAVPQDKPNQGAPDSSSIATAMNSEPAAGDEEPAYAEPPAGMMGEPVPETAEAAAEQPAPELDVAQIMAPRALGEEDAPVTINEYASLTCSHCAHFYNTVFDQLKEAYIDTGKVRFIYNDFPLNTPARDAAIVARCLPQDRYFKFIDFLFETQDDWAYTGNYMQPLIQNAKLLGGSEAKLKACLENEEIKRQLAENMQAAANEHHVEATPTFDINGEVVRGAQSFDVFKEKIDALLGESKKAE